MASTVLACIDRRTIAIALSSTKDGSAQRFVMSEVYDLRGVKCPLNWAKAKVRLETLSSGGALELLLDDPKGVRDIPRAAEAEGYAVLDVRDEGGQWRLVIQR